MSFPAKVKKLFVELNATGNFSIELANQLCEIEYCRDIGLQTKYPILRKNGESEFDMKGYRRYYPFSKFNISVGKQEFIFTNNWFEQHRDRLCLFFESYLDDAFLDDIFYQKNKIL